MHPSASQPVLLLFGEPARLVDGVAERIGGPPRTIALLLYLVLHRDTPIDRRRLAFTLWADFEEHEALANLRRHLHTLARTLPQLPHHGGWFEVSRVSVRWTAADVLTDVTAFEAALATGDDAGAVTHYRGQLCPTVDEAWADGPRRRFTQCALDALDRLIERDRTADLSRAIAWATRAAEIDPWRDSSVRALIELHCLAGDTTAARRLYGDFAERLEREYGVLPDPQTTAAHDRIGVDALPCVIGDPARPVREGQLHVARRKRDATRAMLLDAAEPAVAVSQSVGSAGADRTSHEQRSRERGRPDNVYPISAAVLEADALAGPSCADRLHNLPVPSSSFVGRRREVADVRELVRAHRLVTLVGSGGIGKTRTSLEAAAQLRGEWEHGIWLIELAPLDRAQYIPAAIVRVLGLALGAEGDSGVHLVRALRSKRVLLVFDNCEHLLGEVAVLIGDILRDCPQVNVLASSRQALGIDGEHTYRLPPLDLPPAEHAAPLTVDEVREFGAIELFVERARAAAHRFTLSNDNAAAVAEICRRLDGIPLAIELAAVRMKVLAPQQLRDRIDERFAVLTGGKRNALPRHRTLRALIDWSYDLLDGRERAVFRRLAIFTNGFTLEGAEAVASGDGVAASEVLDALESLVDQSLVLAEPAGDALRYRMLESTHAYARERLDAASERDVSAERHFRYLRRIVAAVHERYLNSCRSVELNAQFATELDDLRAALAYARSTDVRAGAALLADLENSWSMFGLDREGLEQCSAFVTMLPRECHGLRSRLRCIAAQLGANSGRTGQAFAMATEAVADARLTGDVELLAGALRRLVSTAANQDRLAQAAAAQEEAEGLAPLSRFLRLRLLESRAFLARHDGELAVAAEALGTVIAEWRSVGDRHGESIALIDLGEVEHSRGRTGDAIALTQEAILVLRLGRNRLTLAQALCNLTGYSAAIGDVSGCVQAAVATIREASAIDRESPIVAVAIEHLALAGVLAGDVTFGATLAAHAEARLLPHGFERQFTERATRDRLMQLLRERLAPGEWENCRVAGAAMPAEAALEEVLRFSRCCESGMPRGEPTGEPAAFRSADRA